MIRRPLLILPLLVLASCGDDGGSEGTAPTISALSYQPDRATVGAVFQITGTLSFDDPDGDLAAIAFQLTSPGGQTTPPTTSRVQGGGVTQGQLALAVSAIAPSARAYTFDVWVEDDAGHASNMLRGTVVAE